MIEYVPMTSAHVAQVAALEKLCFHDPWSENSVASELKSRYSRWLVAVEEDRLVGYVGSQISFDAADMMNLAVDPGFRRQGVARGLVEALASALKDEGVCCLALEVRASNEPAKALYDQMGFVQVGRRPNYYSNPKEDALILRKEWRL